MTSEKAVTRIAVAIATAILGVLVAAGLPLSRDLTDHILALITVLTPAVVAVIGWLHHNHARIEAAREASKPLEVRTVPIDPRTNRPETTA